ncbi:MAG: hypothetical protein DWQ34_08095 [Planctomycetota bacterium]|nr:MAG: hypothetical protein DWQ29_18570 [Planctomycetota bacterium]REJ94688.1 MAG: hypothetical protein DWQ34_08095 [Planctomycetota bacterium]REK31352.1 MAG: hypothetical protein DWQ41_00440 [Planctomycetota bacterium]REK39077.1 MAG: hypothetical protein DWQ45_02480 [Planctomycetota bacterium]
MTEDGGDEGIEMATKSQRKKQKRKQKQRKNRAQQRRRVAESGRKNRRVAADSARYRQRLERQTPEAWEGEPSVDVAVFDDAVLESLPSEQANQVLAVREALQLAGESRADAALERVAEISRGSPLSEWRLFLRGMVAWMADEGEAAEEAWKRLDPERRPGRMAVALINALRDDLESVTAAETKDQASDAAAESWKDRLDRPLLYHAKLLRRARFDRTAVRIAEAGVRLPDESRHLLLGPRKISWLKTFAKEYRQTEPRLVAALEQVALGRAFAQDYSDLFNQAVRAFSGPRHDRRNLLLSFFYYDRFSEDAVTESLSERALREYLETDLPQNEELSEPLRRAIASQIHLNEALALVRPRSPGFGMNMMEILYGSSEDAKAIRKQFQAAAKAWPANRQAYRAHVDWIESKLENDRLNKAQREPLVEELARVMRDWSRGLPDDAEPRLWLVDHLLENEETEAARPHVEWLAASRQEDPRVRAVPWKWRLLEAMRLCRRKKNIDQVPPLLEEAEAHWPAWLSKAWLPYLQAAVLLRGGQADEYERQREQTCRASGRARDSLADACLMLGAAQQMRVPHSDLKPLRAPVDAAVKGLDELPIEELLLAGECFWDLHRAQLLYPAYRMHGGKLARELWDRLANSRALVVERIDDPQMHSAVLWCSEHRFGSGSYELKLPKWYSRLPVREHRMFVAAKVNALLKMRNVFEIREESDAAPFLREAAQTERDPFYRYWFNRLANDLEDFLKSESRGGFGFDSFSRMFGAADDDDLDFDPDCDCPRCRAARQAHEAKSKS